MPLFPDEMSLATDSEDWIKTLVTTVSILKSPKVPGTLSPCKKNTAREYKLRCSCNKIDDFLHTVPYLELSKCPEKIDLHRSIEHFCEK